MHDATAPNSSGPRCSFCGRSGREAERMVQGPDVYMCASCVRDAVGLLDGEVATGAAGSEPKPKDYKAAYLILTHVEPPVRALMLSVYQPDDHASLLEALAADVRFYRKRDRIESLPEAMREALHDHVESVLHALPRRN